MFGLFSFGSIRRERYSSAAQMLFDNNWEK